MQTESPTQSSELPENQRTALVSLLGDEDPKVYSLVRSQLLSFGPAIREWLKPQTLSSDSRVRRRAVEILTHQARQRGDERFLEFCLRKSENLDLEEGIGMLVQTWYPDANWEAYIALFDVWAADLKVRIEEITRPETILTRLNEFLFERLGFSGDDHYGSDPENCYLNRVVDKRSGNPIGLCVIYLLLARRLGLPITGIGLPGHFICRYQSSTVELYIDCFRKGVFLTKGDCVKYLLQANYGIGEKFLTPLSSRRILARICNNLAATYAHLELDDEAARVQRYVASLTR